MTKRRNTAGAGATAVLLLTVGLTGCGNGDTPADDISPQDTLSSGNTVGTETDETNGPTESPDQ